MSQFETWTYSVNDILTDFEERYKLGATYAANVLRVAYSTYAAYKSGARPMPEHHEAQIELIGLLSKDARKAYIEKYKWPKNKL